MKRSNLQLETIADWDNLITGTWMAASGKRTRPRIRAFLEELPINLNRLQREILVGTVECGNAHRFRIRDPKPRTITAPCFRERVLHHALMLHAGPVLERSLVDDTFACIRGRGTSAAVRRCRRHIQRFSWFAKMDIRQYFPSIDHEILKRLLRRRFKDLQLLTLMDRIIDAYADEPGRGLPIGALTSQCFANFYLGELDRFLLEHIRVRGMVRYMDDFIFWADNRMTVEMDVQSVRSFLNEKLKLNCRDDFEINPSIQGVTMCGYRVYPGTVRLSRTRRRRFLLARRRWESAWLNGEITANELQRSFDAVHGMAAGADAKKWLQSCYADTKNREWYEDV